MKYRLAIFDFDGTLADSFPFFTSMINQLAEQYDFKKIRDEEEQALRHLNAREIIKHVGLPHWKLPLIATSFVAKMGENIDKIHLFPQAEETLGYLHAAGMYVAVITSNSRNNVVRILGLQALRSIKHIDCGMSIFGKSSRINKLLKKTKIAAEATIYIGDQLTDAEAAHKSGVAFGAVQWGYSAIEALRAHAPEEEFTTMLDIKKIV